MGHGIYPELYSPHIHRAFVTIICIDTILSDVNTTAMLTLCDIIQDIPAISLARPLSTMALFLLLRLTIGVGLQCLSLG